MRTGRMPLANPGTPITRGQPALTAPQIAAVVAYLGSLGSAPGLPDVAISGADLALGRDLFIANCAACHGAGGAGDAVGNGIIAPNLGASTPLDVAEAVTGGPPPMPRFSFAPDELNALAAYVQELHHPASPGGISLSGLGPVPEGFIAGLVGLLGLLAVARWIGAAPRRAADSPAPTEEQPFGEDAS
jgi:ubiquinol-cytochrome c reductase cytochrome c subunit